MFSLHITPEPISMLKMTVNMLLKTYIHCTHVQIMEALGLETKVFPWTKLYDEKIFDLNFTVTSFLQYI